MWGVRDSRLALGRGVGKGERGGIREVDTSVNENPFFAIRDSIGLRHLGGLDATKTEERKVIARNGCRSSQNAGSEHEKGPKLRFGRHFGRRWQLPDKYKKCGSAEGRSGCVECMHVKGRLAHWVCDGFVRSHVLKLTGDGLVEKRCPEDAGLSGAPDDVLSLS